MEVFTPLYPVVLVFVLITIGFTFAHWKKISLLPITELIVYLGTPSLVFTSLASKPILVTDIVTLANWRSFDLHGCWISDPALFLILSIQLATLCSTCVVHERREYGHSTGAVCLR